MLKRLIMGGILGLLGLGLAGSPLFASEETIPLDKVKIDLSDFPSLQRGAQTFMNYCSGCHGLKFVRYSTMAQDIGIVDRNGKVLEQAVKDNLMFVGDKISDSIVPAMQKAEGAAWFGVAPPDLSLTVRAKGADWVYSYLRAFYPDAKRPWGVNNRVFPDVAMPHVLNDLQATLSPPEYDRLVADLVNFLSYAAEPHQLARKRLGVFVLLFLGVFLVFAALLKREYWKEVK